jgi:hypothetical protein
MVATSAVYREYEIRVDHDPTTGRWQSEIRPLRPLPGMPEGDDAETLGPFLTPDVACREAEWRIDLLRA